MAKPGPELPPAAAIRALADVEGRLALRVTPGARTEAIEISAGRLQVKVRAKPHDGAANAAVLADLTVAIGVGVGVGLALRLRESKLAPGDWDAPER